MRYCSNCGARMEDKANFCNRCGAPAQENQGIPQKDKSFKDQLFDAMWASGKRREWEESHHNNRFGIISIILFFLGVIIVALIVK